MPSLFHLVVFALASCLGLAYLLALGLAIVDASTGFSHSTRFEFAVDSLVSVLVVLVALYDEFSAYGRL